MRPMTLDDIRARWHRDRAERRARQRLAEGVQAPPPSGVTDPDLLRELDELDAQLMAALPKGRPQTDEMKDKLRIRY